jgi:hypothetical protein
MWKRLYRHLVTAQGREIVRPPERKIQAALQGAEAALGVPLPVQYKGFICQFGPGVLADLFRIYAPVVPETGCRNFDLVREQELLRSGGYWAEKGRPELVARLISFSDTLGGVTIFWDPDDVRGSRTREYGIYVLPRNDLGGKVEELAGSFREFIESVCLGHGFDRFGGYWGAEGPLKQFQPAWRSRKLRRWSSGSRATHEYRAPRNRPRAGVSNKTASADAGGFFETPA